MKAKMYRVGWIIDVYAKTQRQAAIEALRIQRDPESTAVVFDVWECGADLEVTHIDLLEEEPRPKRRK